MVLYDGMKSARTVIDRSWMSKMQVIRADLATSLKLPTPLSLSVLLQNLEQPEVVTLRLPIVVDGQALGGEAILVLRSDGTYSFTGHMRATGALSFAYKVQATARAGTSAMVAMEATGRVFGFDTPGDRQRDWNQNGSSDSIREYWGLLRNDPELDVHVEYNTAGLIGALVDVAETVLETYVAAQLGGGIAALIVLGSDIGAATGQTFVNPNILAGVTVGAGILLVCGPGAIIPALAAGAAVAALADIRFRQLKDSPAELTLARKVFRDQLPVERIIITDLYNPDENNFAREFCIPGLDGSILVNMGKNFDATLQPDVQGRPRYSAPGQVFIHELTHAWQIAHQSFMPGFLCRGTFGDKNYEPSPERISAHAPWNSAFGLEQQATIVDAWFGQFNGNVDSAQALQAPSFWYIDNNIRRGRT